MYDCTEPMAQTQSEVEAANESDLVFPSKVSFNDNIDNHPHRVIEERAEERERGRGNSVKQDNDHVQCQNQCQSVCKNEMVEPGQPPNQEHNARPGFLEARHLSRYVGSESERLANYLETTQNATINENQTVIFSSPYSSHSCYASRTQGDKGPVAKLHTSKLCVL